MRIGAGSLSITGRTAAQLRDRGPATVSEIARALEVSRTSVETAITALVERELVRDAPARVERGAGRPAKRHMFHSAGGSIVGIDIGTSSIRVIVTDLAGIVHARCSFPGVAGAGDGAAKLASVIDAVRETLGHTDFRLPSIRAIGIGLPGIVDDRGKVVTSLIIPEWSGIDISRQLHGCMR